MTMFAEVIGDPIAHSKSPLLHGFWLEELGIAADYRKTRVTQTDIPSFLSERRDDPDWRGCSVTIPHKLEVIPHLDRVDPTAVRIGAVNTIVPRGGELVGYNTDAPGFLEPLRPWLAEIHLWRTTRILGAGGAARAIAHALHAEGFTLVMIARRLEKAAALAAEFGDNAHAVALAQLADPIDFDWGDLGDRLDLVVNATSLGMNGQPPLEIDFSHVPPHAIVYDAVYSPLETPLLAEARARGLRSIDGLSMLIGQARIGFEHFFGVAPPSDRETDLRLRARLMA